MDELDKQLENLRQAFESGALDEATYRAAADSLRQSATQQVEVSGSGALAQSGAIAAGAGGLAAGVIQGNVYYGPVPRNTAEILEIYRQVYVAGCRQLPLRGVDVGASDPGGQHKRIDLDQVYIALDTTTQVPVSDDEKKRQRQQLQEFGDRQETRPLSILEAAIANPHLVVLGDPGSGKSTFLSHLGLCLALDGMDPKGDWLDRLPGWPARGRDILPINVVLRDFARTLPERLGRSTPQLLWNFIETRLNAQKLAFAAEAVADALEQGQAMVLLDGLDEIPKKKQRRQVRDAVEAFLTRYPRCRIVVTCRTLSYQDPAWQLTDFPAHELAPFDRGKIDQFIDAWYAELGRMGAVKAEASAGLAERLKEAVHRPDLWRLAPNPLLLTVMALVHAHKGRLPDARALLYEDTVDILLWRWEQIKAGPEEELPQLRQLLLDAGRADVDLKRVLWQLAFEAHGQGRAADAEALADISEWQLEKALAELNPDNSRDWAVQLIEAMKLRAGLLLERAPEVYTFPHRTFQEYLAGAHLAAQKDFARQATRLTAEGEFWRQVILMAVGRLVYLGGDVDKPTALVGELCPNRGKESDLAWRRVWLAGDVLLEAGLNRVQDSVLGQDLMERTQGRLAALLRAGLLSPVERTAAGDTLGRLGDPRFRTDAWYLPDEPLLGFVEVRAGPFLMGTRPEDIPGLMERYGGRKEWYEDETPQHQLDLPTCYMARYPVTVTQFRAFHETQSRDPSHVRGISNHPVVNVSWYDAVAYCEWLTERLRSWDETPEPLAQLLREEGWRITLPSEAQWEKTARGDDGRQFPWRDDPDPNVANYAETGIRGTSAVGCFRGGACLYGCLDMSGNVWEWTRSLWGENWDKPEYGYPYDPQDGREDLEAPNRVLRVLRGGSFYSNENYVRCAARARVNPNNRDRGYGFRVCASPRSTL